MFRLIVKFGTGIAELITESSNFPKSLIVVILVWLGHAVTARVCTCTHARVHD